MLILSLEYDEIDNTFSTHLPKAAINVINDLRRRAIYETRNVG